jgi:hypothetical protein
MPWFFNQGYQSSPATVFFDGHIAQLGVAEAVDAYNRVAKSPTAGDATMKIAGTFATTVPGMPIGYAFGAFDNGAYFDGKYVSYHVLTADGILGRDTMGQK